MSAAALGASVSRSAGGFLDVFLEARPEPGGSAGSARQMLTYNGLMPGPTLETRAGDTLRLRLKNSLSEATNLHFHGLHVSPIGNADNPFLSAPPGEILEYEVKIPDNHPGGTFWYHPHLHGTTARQVFGGLSGLIIVRGELDSLPEIASSDEQLLILKDFSFDRTGRIHDANPMERIQGREGNVITVNGKTMPFFAIQRNGLTRFRALNASASRYYRLRVEEHPMAIIATDGGALPRVDWVEDLLVVPGQRAEFLIQGIRSPGVYRILSLPYDRGSMGMGGGSAAASTVLAQLAYLGSSDTNFPVPDQLPDVAPLPMPTEPARTFYLEERMMGFKINGRAFDANRIDTVVRLETLEDWELINLSGMDHPFHVHTNAFQLVDSGGLAERAWRDVVNVPRGTRRRIRLRFSDYTGRTVYHCHILDHEDLGMMGTLRIGN